MLDVEMLGLRPASASDSIRPNHEISRRLNSRGEMFRKAFGIHLCQSFDDNLELRGCFFESHARLQACHHRINSWCTRTSDCLARVGNRYPGLLQSAERLEPPRHDPHERPRLAVHEKAPAQDIRVSVELPLPRPIAHH